MERITIEVGDDGTITVTAESPDESPEQMTFDDPAEAASAVQELLVDAQQSAGGGEDDDLDPESMWDEEAARRPANPNLMA